MNVAMINTCQRPISFSNGFQRDFQQAQCEQAAGLFFFLFISLQKKASPAIFSCKSWVIQETEYRPLGCVCRFL